MKKIFAVLMSLVLGGSLCACGNDVQTLGENTGKEVVAVLYRKNRQWLEE